MKQLLKITMFSMVFMLLSGFRSESPRLPWMPVYKYKPFYKGSQWVYPLLYSNSQQSILNPWTSLNAFAKTLAEHDVKSTDSNDTKVLLSLSPTMILSVLRNDGYFTSFESTQEPKALAPKSAYAYSGNLSKEPFDKLSSGIVFLFQNSILSRTHVSANEASIYGALHMSDVDEVWVFNDHASTQSLVKSLARSYGLKVYSAKWENDHFTRMYNAKLSSPRFKDISFHNSEDLFNLLTYAPSAVDANALLSVLADMGVCKSTNRNFQEVLMTHCVKARQYFYELSSDSLLTAKERVSASQYLFSTYGNMDPWLDSDKVYAVLKSLSLKDALLELKDFKPESVTGALARMCTDCHEVLFKTYINYVAEARKESSSSDLLNELDDEASMQFGNSKTTEDFEKILEKPRLNMSEETLQLKLDLLFRGLDFYLNLGPSGFEKIVQHFKTALIFDAKNYQSLLSILKNEKNPLNPELRSALKKMDDSRFSEEQRKNYLDFKGRF